ncbi:unnamed protein product [Prunus armeniaca]|uniref:Uncharacterized protein n=1 Tax=Prunus armeniaca TaxID=36596 RepID=A0A6J5VWQ1_PRUAR|nr:unnamed protein product [Prunus armeniaca]
MQEEIEMRHINTDDQVVDLFAKGLSTGKFENFRHQLNVVQRIFLGDQTRSRENELEEGEGNDEAGGLEGGEGTEEQMPLHIYRITTNDESHCLGVVLIEECEDAHELHEKVMDVIFENGDLEEYDTPSIEEYTVLYLQLNGDNIYRITEYEETELVGWKGVRIEDCNGDIEALDEMDEFDKELRLEIEWDVFTHLVRGVVAFSEDPWSEFEWLDGDERYIDLKLKKEDGILVSMCRITIDGKGTPWGIFYLTQKSNKC